MPKWWSPRDNNGFGYKRHATEANSRAALKSMQLQLLIEDVKKLIRLPDIQKRFLMAGKWKYQGF